MIELPEFLKGYGLIDFLSEQRSDEVPPEITVDFSALRRITPVGMVTLAALINHWRRKKAAVEITGVNECKIADYLHRMDLFQAIAL